MKGKDIKEIAVITVTLFLIAAICTALLAGTNLLTKDKIEEITVQQETAAKAAVLADAASFSEAKTLNGTDGEFTYFEGYDESGAVIGYVFPISTKSYGGDLACMVGVASETESISGVKITAINDTAGLGMKAKNDEFVEQYIGRSGVIGVNKNTSTDTEIQAITGATITSKAVTGAVNKAFAQFTMITAGDNNG